MLDNYLCVHFHPHKLVVLLHWRVRRAWKLLVGRCARPQALQPRRPQKVIVFWMSATFQARAKLAGAVSRATHVGERLWISGGKQCRVNTTRMKQQQRGNVLEEFRFVSNQSHCVLRLKSSNDLSKNSLSLCGDLLSARSGAKPATSGHW